MSSNSLIAFVLFATVLAITPGPDMALVTKNALRYGRASALMTAVGVSIGMSVWTGASALGIAGLIASSAVAFNVVRVLGASYLIYLGLRMFWESRRKSRPSSAEELLVGRSSSPIRCLQQGMLGNLLNPKAALIFTSLIPQFIPTGAPVAAISIQLGLILSVIVLVWLLCYATAASGAGQVLRRPRIEVFLQRLTGCVLVGLGLRLATEARPG